MSPSVLSLRGVALARGGARLLDEVDLEVRAGERWALLGPNGCGKTTLLSLLGALQHPSAGTVEVLGHRLGRVDLQRVLWPRIGHVQGRHRPAGRPTARDVVLTGLFGTSALPLRWSPSAGDLAAADGSLDALGAGPVADRPWHLLSNGEQRRTLIARALVRVPDLLLLDEPAAGLDLPAREHLVDALDRLAGERPDLAWVLVSHHVEELPRATSHAALLRAGRVTAAGPADRVLTAGPLSDCFGLPLAVRREGGRWSARRA